MLERIEREAVNLERVARHNDQVPDLYAHFAENGQFYLVQEYIEGDTVVARVGRGYLDIKAELESFQSVMDNFDLTFIRFLKSFETSPVFLQKLIAVLAKTLFFQGRVVGAEVSPSGFSSGRGRPGHYKMLAWLNGNESAQLMAGAYPCQRVELPPQDVAAPEI